jgi:hypothetical protein
MPLRAGGGLIRAWHKPNFFVFSLKRIRVFEKKRRSSERRFFVAFAECLLSVMLRWLLFFVSRKGAKAQRFFFCGFAALRGNAPKRVMHQEYGAR